jgi:hypothetical protein
MERAEAAGLSVHDLLVVLRPTSPAPASKSKA